MINWTRRDTALVVAASLLPVLTAILSLVAPLPTIGAVTPVLFVWTFWAVVGLVLATYKVSLLAGDQYAMLTLRSDFRSWLGGLWSLSNATSLLMICALWVVVGVLAMLQIPLANVSTGILMAPHGVVLGTIVFGILCRRKLAE